MMSLKYEKESRPRDVMVWAAKHNFQEESRTEAALGNAAKSLGTAVAEQADGHPEVFVKNDSGKTMGKLANGVSVTILRQDDTRFEVDYAGTVGWAQKRNFKRIRMEASPGC